MLFLFLYLMSLVQIEIWAHSNEEQNTQSFSIYDFYLTILVWYNFTVDLCLNGCLQRSV